MVEHSSRQGAATVLCGLLLLASAFLGWIRTGGATLPGLRGIDLPGGRWLLGLVALGLTLGGLRMLADGSGGAARTVAVVAAFGVLSSGLFVVALEAAGFLLPTWVLPAILRRSTVAFGAGPGAWAALLLCTVALLDCRNLLKRTVALSPTAPTSRRVGWVLMAVGTACYAIVRYEPWVSIRGTGVNIRIEGWALPFLGPFTFLLFLALAVIGVVLGFRASQSLVLLGVALVWVQVAMHLMVLSLGRGLERIELQGWHDRLMALVEQTGQLQLLELASQLDAPIATTGSGAYVALGAAVVACTGLVMQVPGVVAHTRGRTSLPAVVR